MTRTPDHQDSLRENEGERVFLYHPADKTGEACKFARPYHGPYRILPTLLRLGGLTTHKMSPYLHQLLIEVGFWFIKDLQGKEKEEGLRYPLETQKLLIGLYTRWWMIYQVPLCHLQMLILITHQEKVYVIVQFEFQLS